jgi:hypothetical protein
MKILQSNTEKSVENSTGKFDMAQFYLQIPQMFPLIQNIARRIAVQTSMLVACRLV